MTTLILTLAGVFLLLIIVIGLPLFMFLRLVIKAGNKEIQPEIEKRMRECDQYKYDHEIMI